MKLNRSIAVVGVVFATAISALAIFQTKEITIQSDGDRVYRRVDHDGSVRLVRRLSDKPCVEGRSWGYDRNGIWVNDGCRAIFRYEVGSADDRRRDDIFRLDKFGIEDIFKRPSNTADYATERFKLESNDGRRATKRIDTSGGVRLVRKLSDAPCVQGRSWGYDRNSVWVDDRCRAEFEVRVRRDGRYDRDRDDRGQVFLPGRGVPNWAVGNWVGIRQVRDLSLRIRNDGSAVFSQRNNLRGGERRGEIRGNRLDVGEMTFRVEKQGNYGIVLYPVRASTGPLHFRKD
jgi:hypothetical protein